jgi:hypothetical protein
MLKIAFEAKLAAPEPVFVQSKFVGPDVFEDGDFYRFVRNRELVKQEGLILKHLLRLVTLADEFFAMTQDPDYQRMGELSTNVCHAVDPRYTDKYLADLKEIRKIASAEMVSIKT